MKNILIIIFFLVFSRDIFGQKNNTLDSLYKLIPITNNDSLKLVYFHKICDLCDVKDNLRYGSEALKYTNQIEMNKSISISKKYLLEHKAFFLTIVNVYYEDINDYENQINTTKRLYPIYTELKDTAKLENAYCDVARFLMKSKKFNEAFELANSRILLYERTNNLELIAKYQSQLLWQYDQINYYDKMVEYAEKYLATNKKMKDVKGIASAHSTLATAYRYNGNQNKALENNLKSLYYFKKEKDKRKIFRALYETSLAYAGINDFKKALEYSDLCLNIATELRDTSLLDYIYFGKVSLYNSMKEFKKAEEFAIKHYDISIKNNNEFNIMNSSIALGEIYIDLKMYNKALKYIEILNRLAIKQNDVYALRNSFRLKFNLYKQTSAFEEALNCRLKYDSLNENIIALENHKGFEQKELISQFEKNEQRVKEEQELKDKESQDEKRKQRIIIIVVCIGLIFLSILLLLIYRNYRIKQKSNIELFAKNELIANQKHLVDEKQKEIIESITYAKRLQEAILPPQEFINKYIPNNFILYKPKDLVAGDFYWAEKINDKFFIAAADSTGHGVPGAMVSVVCSNALNRTIKEFGLTETGKILDKTRELVLETFEKSTSEVKDGMDISLLCIDAKNKHIFWSGANNPLWYIQNNELKEIKADKQPIGKTEYPKPFTTHQIEYKKDTTFYLFTDGFADQFGGPNGKKFKYKQFSDLLLKHTGLLQAEQSAIIDKAFTEWKGDLEQVDDVCVIGIKI